MKIPFYAMYDSDVGFKKPVAIPNDKVALRSFRQLCEDPNPNEINQNAQCISIWRIAQFDDELGIFVEDKSKLADAAPFVLAAREDKKE